MDKAYEYAVFLLSLRLRTIGELREKMEKRGYLPSVIEQTVERLYQQKYLDDRRYAEIFLDNLKRYRNLGYYGIKKKLMQKKLPNDLIDKTLEEGLSKEEELEIGKRLLKKEGYAVKDSEKDDNITYSSYDLGEAGKEKQKIANRLKSRGFRSDVIAKLVF